MKAFYEEVSRRNPNRELVVLTVAEGPDAGEKALLESGELVWTSAEGGYLSTVYKELAVFDQAGVLARDGRKIYREALGGEKRLVICGGGHVSMQVVTLGKLIGFSVTVLEDRETFAENARRKGADDVICAPFEEGLSRVPGDKDTYFVIVTRDHRWDRECLRAIEGKPCAYVGMMGSRRRVAMVKQRLLEEGVAADFLDRVHTPIGLSIGAETPEEIAVSILAEIIRVKNEDRRTFGYQRDMLKAILSGEVLPCVMATIIGREGSGPRDVGTKMLITADRCIGTIGGGAEEWEITLAARDMLGKSTAGPVILHQDLMASSEDEEAMVCGGRLAVMLERISV